MVSSEKSFTTVSAPGKVLLAGGYLVLDPVCKGLVFALSARIHVIASSLPGSGLITVSSPQFANATWEYKVELSDQGGGANVEQLNKELVALQVSENLI